MSAVWKYDVWKYDVEITEEQVISMPRGAKPLHVADQYSDSLERRKLQVWVLVDPDAPMVEHVVRVVGTGHGALLQYPGQFAGTVLLADGALVFHVFMHEAGNRTRAV